MSDWRELTKEAFTAGDSANSLTADQKQSAKRVYEECISFLDEFLFTDGFMDFCHGTCGSSSARELEEIVETKRERLVTALDMERFLLKGTDIYAGFEEYIYDVLPFIYRGKLGYAYRHEPNGRDAMSPSAEDDYYMALNKLNSIIDTYIGN